MLFDKQSNFLRTDYRSRNFKGDWTKHFIDDLLIRSLQKEEIKRKPYFLSSSRNIFQQISINLCLQRFIVWLT